MLVDPRRSADRMSATCQGSPSIDSASVHNAHIEQFKFLRVVCAWTYLKKSLNIFDITYFYPNANNPEENSENSIFVNLTL